MGARPRDIHVSLDWLRSDVAKSTLNAWQQEFARNPKARGMRFLHLLTVDKDPKPIKPTYADGGSWLPQFHHSNSLTARACRCILNHAPIGTYRKRFFPHEPHRCECGYFLESRPHLLSECRLTDHGELDRRVTTLGALRRFLEKSPRAFSFKSGVE